MNPNCQRKAGPVLLAKSRGCRRVGVPVRPTVSTRARKRRAQGRATVPVRTVPLMMAGDVIGVRHEVPLGSAEGAHRVNQPLIRPGAVDQHVPAFAQEQVASRSECAPRAVAKEEYAVDGLAAPTARDDGRGRMRRRRCLVVVRPLFVRGVEVVPPRLHRRRRAAVLRRRRCRARASAWCRAAGGVGAAPPATPEPRRAHFFSGPFDRGAPAVETSAVGLAGALEGRAGGASRPCALAPDGAAL